MIADARNKSEAGPSQSGVLGTPKMVTETPAGKRLSEGERQNTEREETIRKAKSVPSVNEDVVAAKDSKKKAERAKKQRLVSYSSQDSQDLERMGSRKS